MHFYLIKPNTLAMNSRAFWLRKTIAKRSTMNIIVNLRSRNAILFSSLKTSASILPSSSVLRISRSVFVAASALKLLNSSLIARDSII